MRILMNLVLLKNNSFLVNSSKMSTKANSCYLQSLDGSGIKFRLPDREIYVFGRNEATKITDPKVSRKQFLFKADYSKRKVKCVATGPNYSGCDGFALLRNKMYVLGENSRIELLLGGASYELKFEPKIDSSESNKWEIIDRSLMVYNICGDVEEEEVKVAGFDMDGTLIKTKSGEKFPVDYKDWVLWSSEVKPKLESLIRDGFRLVIFSNQSRLGSEKAAIPNFKKKIEAITRSLNLPLLVLIATKRDIYRKPAPGMFNYLERIIPNIIISESFYVGDAAGREKNWAPGKKRDHSSADRLFAMNLNLKFYTPEEFFFNARKVSYKMPEFDPRSIHPIPQEIPLNLDKQEAVMLVGCQGSGKSYFYKTNIESHKYVWINRDTLGSKEKCLRSLEDNLRNGRSVVIDNTHQTRESRAGYLDVCRKHNVPVKCFLMSLSSKHVKHNNLFRILTDANHTVITEIMINSYLKNFEKPTLGEGFEEIYEFKFDPKFQTEHDEKLYKMFLLES